MFALFWVWQRGVGWPSNRLHFADSAQHQSVPALLEECSSIFGHRALQDPDFGEMDFRNHRLRALIPELYLLSELEYFDLLTSVQEYRVPRCGL